MVIPSYKGRSDILRGLLDYIGKNRPPHLYEVIIVWNSDKDTLFPIDQYNFLINVYFAENQSVAYRFKPEILTNCFFSFDDDLRMPVKDIEKGFELWKSHQDQIVGYSKRTYVKTNWGYQYLYNAWKNYTMVLTNHAFFHKNYTKDFYSNKYQKAVDFIDSINNCEDIFMNFVIAAKTHKPPIFIDGKFQHVSKSGISSGPKHLSKRNQCVKVFKENLSLNLIETNIEYSV